MSESWTLSICVPEQETHHYVRKASSCYQSPREAPTKAEGVYTLQENSDSSSDSSEFEHLHTIFWLGIKAKFVVTVKINKVPIETEVDSGVERSTVSLSVSQCKLVDVYELRSSSISLHQYNKLTLTIAGEFQATVKINHRVIQATFVVVEVEKQLP